MEAWGDWNARLVQLRDATRMALERGQVDKFGRNHDEEQRAVLHILNELIAYVPGLIRDYDKLRAHLEAEEARAGQPIYGMDQIDHLTSDF